MLPEYSFCALTRNLGDRTKPTTNPFTGESIATHIDDGLTAEEMQALKSVFDANGIEGPEPEFEGYARHWDQGDSVRFRGFELGTEQPVRDFSAEIVCGQLTGELLSILLSAGQIGNLALASSTGEDVCVIGSEPTEAQLTRWGEVRTIRSEAGLRDWLDNTIGFREVTA